MKVLIITITAELPRFYEYYDSLDRMHTPPGTEKLPVHSSSPAKNRNLAIRAALKTGNYTHIFFTDDDHEYAPTTLMRLLSHNVDIVSGTYCMKFTPFPIIALNNPNKNNMSQFVNMNEVGNPGLFEVARVPAGCLLVTTNALQNIQNKLRQIDIPYNDHPGYTDKFFTLGQIQPDEWGDDLWFCDRARDAGYKIYLDTQCPVGHITKTTLWPKWDGKQWNTQFRINEGYQIGTAIKEGDGI